MNNVLIYYRKENLAPTGGPRGYLYNLYQGLQKAQNEEVTISFLPGNTSKSIANNKTAKNKYNKLPLSIKNIYRIYGRYNEYRAFKAGIPTIQLEEIKKYDAIHFHDVFAVYKNRKVLEQYKGKVILTTHCPKPPQLEKIEDMYSDFERFLYGRKHLAFYENCVKYAFKRADYIMFPCKEAEEPYFNNWDYYHTIHELYDEKFIYMPTGLQDCFPKVKTEREKIREKYNIPNDAFVVSFVGRHNAVKGYDVLREIGQSVNNNKVYFLIAGEESPLQRPNVANWREVGWTNDPYSIIKASDLFVLPNKETYFDLVLLEVLSLGTAVLASRTGGNKYFNTLESGIHLYNSKEEAVDFIEKSCSCPDKINQMGDSNRRLFEAQFTDVKFAENYMEILQNL